MSPTLAFAGPGPGELGARVSAAMRRMPRPEHARLVRAMTRAKLSADGADPLAAAFAHLAAAELALVEALGRPGCDALAGCVRRVALEVAERMAPE